MKKYTYIKMTAPFRENNRAARKLELINKICTYLVFITYPVYVLYLCFTAGHMLALSIIAPLVGFIASAFPDRRSLSGKAGVHLDKDTTPFPR